MVTFSLKLTSFLYIIYLLSLSSLNQSEYAAIAKVMLPSCKIPQGEVLLYLLLHLFSLDHTKNNRSAG